MNLFANVVKSGFDTESAVLGNLPDPVRPFPGNGQARQHGGGDPGAARVRAAAIGRRYRRRDAYQVRPYQLYTPAYGW